MSHPNPNLPPSKLTKPPPLHKHKSLSTDFYREEAWARRKNNHQRLHRRSKSLITTEDIDEFKGCVDLGFHFTSESNKLSKTFPALNLYYATSSPPTPSLNSSTTTSNCGDSPQQPCSPHQTATASNLFTSGDLLDYVLKLFICLLRLIQHIYFDGVWDSFSKIIYVII